MENVILRKKLSTYLSDGGHLKNVSEDVLLEVLRAWEEWQGTSKEFYRAIGFTQRQMAKLLGKAKKLKRDGHFGTEQFKEMTIEAGSTSPADGSYIEVHWGQGKIIRFPQVQQLLEFLEKAG